MSTLTGTTIIRGIEVELLSECDVQWVDDSFSHEFGTEHCGHAEVESIDPVQLDCDVRHYAMRELLCYGRPHHRRKFIKWVRRIEREVANLDPDTFWTQDQLDEAVDGWEPPEPDFGE